MMMVMMILMHGLSMSLQGKHHSCTLMNKLYRTLACLLSTLPCAEPCLPLQQSLPEHVMRDIISHVDGKVQTRTSAERMPSNHITQTSRSRSLSLSLSLHM